MSSNLPPGVTDGMIPGNRAEDLEWEEFHAWIDEQIEKHNISFATARIVWLTGMGEDHA